MKTLITALALGTTLAQAASFSSHPNQQVVILEQDCKLVLCIEDTDTKKSEICEFKFKIPSNDPFFHKTTQVQEASGSLNNTNHGEPTMTSSTQEQDTTETCIADARADEYMARFIEKQTEIPAPGSLTLFSFCSGSLIFLRRILII